MGPRVRWRRRCFRWLLLLGEFFPTDIVVAAVVVVVVVVFSLVTLFALF